MSRDFFKSLLHIASQHNEFAGAVHGLDPLVIGPDKGVQIGFGHAILPPGIIGRFDLDWP